MPARRQAMNKAAAPPTRRQLRETQFWRSYMASRYAILFYVLLLTLLVMPIASQIGMPKGVIRLLIGACLLSAIMPNASKHTRAVFFGGVLLLVLVRFASDRDDVPINSAYMVALVGLVGLIAAGKSLEYTVGARAVSSETLYAALSTYLLAGIFFGQIYWSVESFFPGSLVGPDPMSEATAVYYSFVTLATLGYGDFVPRTDVARGLAIFEVIGGQLFLAVMVARLIGLFSPGSGKR